jgi:hypothetical protein
MPLGGNGEYVGGIDLLARRTITYPLKSRFVARPAQASCQPGSLKTYRPITLTVDGRQFMRYSLLQDGLSEVIEPQP